MVFEEGVKFGRCKDPRRDTISLDQEGRGLDEPVADVTDEKK